MDETNQDYSAEALIARKRDTWPAASSQIADIVVRLFRLRDIIHNSSRAKAKAAYDLTSAEFEVIVTLRTIEPPHALTPTELRRSMLITPGGLTKVMRNLEKRGLIERRKHETDQRSWRIQLTASGVDLAEQALATVLADYEALITKGLNEKQMTRLSKLLELSLNRIES